MGQEWGQRYTPIHQATNACHVLGAMKIGSGRGDPELGLRKAWRNSEKPCFRGGLELQGSQHGHMVSMVNPDSHTGLRKEVGLSSKCNEELQKGFRQSRQDQMDILKRLPLCVGA